MRHYWQYKEGYWQSVPAPQIETKGEWYRCLVQTKWTKSVWGADTKVIDRVWHHIRHDGCDNPGRQSTIVTKEQLPAELRLTLTLLEIEP